MSDQENRPAPAELTVDHDQPAPGREADMQLKPDSHLSNYRPAGKLIGKVALITGGGSGIGRAVPSPMPSKARTPSLPTITVRRMRPRHAA
jgi:hypothetical protein